MIIINQITGEAKKAEAGDQIEMRDGTLYIVGAGGNLIAVRAESTKRISPGKRARKMRRAWEIEDRRNNRNKTLFDATAKIPLDKNSNSA